MKLIFSSVAIGESINPRQKFLDDIYHIAPNLLILDNKPNFLYKMSNGKWENNNKICDFCISYDKRIWNSFDTLTAPSSQFSDIHYSRFLFSSCL